MYLSREEVSIYQGKQGETLRRMMDILVALGDIYQALTDASERLPQILRDLTLLRDAMLVQDI